MEPVSLAVPTGIIDALPEGDDAAEDMHRAVTGYERRLNTAIGGEGDAASAVVDAIERFERRWEAYDEYVVELRAWGQSPIYAMAWRDLHASLIDQLYDHDRLGEVIDRERHARIVQDGIRFDP